ncbi:MAG: extracellular solute-binding protein [Clostridia bacterium]|nr:extracellular solute-binding protein [Clostridia bacterium]
MRKKFSAALAVCLLLSSASFTACDIPGFSGLNDNVLRVASWDEYIDMGGEDVYDEAFMAWYQETFNVDLATAQPLYEEFLGWYHENYSTHPDYQKDFAGVEYIALQDNETMYNKIKMGDKYDLLCPSEYMAIKLKNEGKLQPYDTKTFLDASNPLNHYAKNVSPYVSSVISDPNVDLQEYLAGYMWGTTGFVFNPEKISPETMKSWHCMTSAECSRRITAKDNARDSYFMGLGMYFEDKIKAETPTKDELYQLMNDTSPETVDGVRKCLQKMRKNIYGLETDEAKTDMIMGWLDASYQWSGDAVFILDEAESESDLALQYSIPESASNIWFDGWVMMNGANEHIATAFINFLSLPENVVRNMYYIGYTSCMGSEKVYEYVDYTYGDEEGDAEYDLSYFFGDGYAPLTVSSDQLTRQLFAQYPDEETTKRLVVMKPFGKEDNERVNRMWINIK